MDSFVLLGIFIPSGHIVLRVVLENTMQLQLQLFMIVKNANLENMHPTMHRQPVTRAVRQPVMQAII
jgi:hypothetical protein